MLLTFFHNQVMVNIVREAAARLMDISGRSIRRWLAGEFMPNYSSRMALKRELRRISRNL
jgi:hypothetical protein